MGAILQYGLSVALVGIGTVFVGLIILIALIKLMEIVMASATGKKKAAAPAPAPAPVQAAAPAEDDAEIAARMAAQERFRPAGRDRRVPASLRAYARLVSSADKGAVRIVDDNEE